jgi:hypothetical protein
VWMLIYRKILGFYSIVGSPMCKESSIYNTWIVLCLEAHLVLEAVWPLPVLVNWVLWSLCHVIILIQFWWALVHVGLLAGSEQFFFFCKKRLFNKVIKFILKWNSIE